jgi:formylglycine-generating enzyme required for sulfatase activity/serine/threonine protein kinase
MSTPSPVADRNLIFGLLALQMDFITREQLLDAMNSWMLDKQTPLAEILCQRHVLADDDRFALDALVERHVARHGNPQASLAALRVEPSVRRDLDRLDDADVQASLAGVPAQDSPATNDGKSEDSLAGLPTTAPVGDAAFSIRFRRLREHAKGGLGEVFVALDSELEREVALKEIQARHADHPESRARFLTEGRVTGALEHPGIVPVYGMGVYADGRPYYAMRFIKGDSLKDAIAAFHACRSREPSGTFFGPARLAGPTFRSLAFRQLLGRFVDVCNAIAYAHSRGVIHRDIKPDNVMLGKFGETLVVDWGLAKVVGHADVEATTESVLISSGDSALTQAGQALGTPAFMSPEQAAGRLDRLGPATDTYSLGATLYCLLTGKVSFSDNDVGVVLAKVQKGDFKPPRHVNARIPPALEAVCLKAMALKPEDRYASPRELAGEIERFLADEPVSAYREPFRVRAGRWARRHPAVVAGSTALVFTVLLAVTIGGLLLGREQQAKLEQQRKARQAQVATLLDVAPHAPAILEALQPHSDEIRPFLQEAASKPKPADATPEAVGLWRQHRARAALALLAEEPAHKELLAERLLEEGLDPAEMLLVRDALKPHAADLTEELWRTASAKKNEARRFRALVALAAYDAESPRWQVAAGQALAELLTANPLHLGQWVDALRPVRQHLVSPLAKVFRGEDDRLREYRLVAANVLADYAAGNPKALANLLMDADEKQFAVIYPKLKEQAEQASTFLTGEIDKKLPAELPSSDVNREKLAKRQANAAVALLRLGSRIRQNAGDEPPTRILANAATKVWPLLKHSPDPRARTYLIHRLSPLGAAAGAILERLDNEPDVTIRRALLLSLGEYGEKEFPADAREALLPKLREMYRTASDPGLHAASEWLLRKWKQAAWLKQINNEWAKGKVAGGAWRVEGKGKLVPPPSTLHPSPGWYVNNQGQTMVVIPGPVEFAMGSPPSEEGRTPIESQHKRRIGRTFALAAKHVTVGEFRRFLRENKLEAWFEAGGQAAPLMKRYSPAEDGPIILVDWYRAAAYCNWLSQKEGIPEEQRCYETNARQLSQERLSVTLSLLAPQHALARAAAARYLSLVVDQQPQVTALKKNYLSLQGYRLPTEAEMEYGCRAGAVTSRYYGQTEELLGQYGWYQHNSKERVHPVGSKKPNDLGLFDMHGNVFNWCQESYKNYPVLAIAATTEDKEDSLSILNARGRVLRGGSFSLRASLVRSAIRNSYGPADRTYHFGFRPARTFR